MRNKAPAPFNGEGGTFYLADALFHTFKYQIRCPRCVGNSTEPGFIKDQAGKPAQDGGKRRYWACQYSNTQR